ncbi:MAG: hypothetical protein WCK10_00725 [Candidatus Staskawiczbacteria bacterium]
MFKFNKSSGQASKLLLVLAVVVFVAVIIVFLVMKMAEKPKQPPIIEQPEIIQPVYETTLGNIRFVFQSALDKGSALLASEVVNKQYAFSQKNLDISNPGAKFIQVIIGAQNKGTLDTERGAWDIGNIIDSAGRNFIPLENSAIMPWLPNPNPCGERLQPAFDPTPCKKIYEVSKESTGLKVEVKTGKNNTATNLSSKKIDSFLIDLIVM